MAGLYYSASLLAGRAAPYVLPSCISGIKMIGRTAKFANDSSVTFGSLPRYRHVASCRGGVFMQLHCKADNSCSQIWGVCVRWFSTRDIAGLKRGNLGGFRNFIAKRDF